MMFNNLSIQKIEETIDTGVIAGLNYMTGVDNSHLSTIDVIWYIKDSLVGILKKD